MLMSQFRRIRILVQQLDQAFGAGNRAGHRLLRSGKSTAFNQFYPG